MLRAALFITLTLGLDRLRRGCAGCARPCRAPSRSRLARRRLEDLVAAAQAEGCCPPRLVQLRRSLDSFSEKYGIRVNELDPNAGSGDELEAVRANKDNKGPQAPDVIDVGHAFGPLAQEEGLIQPYKVATWDSIPDDVKDAEGYWYGDYYGVLAFQVNTDIVENVPQDWADLLKPEYKGQVALAGDPRTSAQAIMSVYAAALANGGDIENASRGWSSSPS